MKTALALLHVAFEDLGSLHRELSDAGFEIETVDACTADLRAIDALAPDLLVILGGPIGVYEQRAYPFIENELELLRARLGAQRPTLGICLGAQLMAAALGARVYPGGLGKELGWAPLHAPSESSSAGWFDVLLKPDLQVLHWHGDTFDLPADAVHLAATPRYAHQAFAIGQHALALQFHPEATVCGLERWYVGHACELAHAGIDVRQLRIDSELYAPRLEQAARQFWRQWLALAFPPASVIA